MSWSPAFHIPISPPDGRVLRTLRDAGRWSLVRIDVGISRQKDEGATVRLIVYPDAHFGFDNPTLKKPITFLGHHLEYNERAAQQSAHALREFLNSVLSNQ